MKILLHKQDVDVMSDFILITSAVEQEKRHEVWLCLAIMGSRLNSKRVNIFDEQC